MSDSAFDFRAAGAPVEPWKISNCQTHPARSISQAKEEHRPARRWLRLARRWILPLSLPAWLACAGAPVRRLGRVLGLPTPFVGGFRPRRAQREQSLRENAVDRGLD